MAPVPSTRVTPGNICREEDVGVPFFNANHTLPPTTQIYNVPQLPFNETFLSRIFSRLQDVPSRLKAMDDHGISYFIVSMTSPGIEGIFDPKTAVDLARSVPLQDPVAAAHELEYCVTQLGALGVLVNGFTNLPGPGPADPDNVRYLDDPAVLPFWAMLSKLNVPLYLHPRAPPPGQQRLYTDYPNLAHAAYGFGVDSAGHALRIMCSGVLDTFPNVGIILGHAAEALPFLIHRIDHCLAIGIEGANGKHRKSMGEYFRINFYATRSGVRQASALACTLEELGSDKVMFSVDYPYEDCGEAVQWFDEHVHLESETRYKVAEGNARRIFGLD